MSIGARDSAPVRGGRRGDVLEALRASPVPLSILELAAQLDLHPNTVRFHLDALVSSGQAEQVRMPHTGPGRPPQMYRSHPGMDPAGPRNYRLLAEILTDQLTTEPDATARATHAGKAWGHRLPHPDRPADAAPSVPQALDTLVRTLDELGFAPQLDTDDTGRTRIRLRHCPFLDMTGGRPTVVCAVHLGLMQGVLDAQGAPVTVDRLEPFTEPDVCLTHLTALPQPHR